MSGTINGIDPNSGLSFSYGVIDPAAPVNTAAQDFSAISAAAGFAGAVAGLAANPSPLTALGAVGTGANVASKVGDIGQGLADFGNAIGYGPAQNVGGYAANQIEVGMMEGEANPLPAGTITGNDLGDPSPPAAAPGVIPTPTTFASLSEVTPALDTSAGVITSPGINGFLVPEVGGGFLHLDPGAQMDGGLDGGGFDDAG